MSMLFSRRFLVIAFVSAISVSLSGCFIDETINETKKVNSHLEETNHNQGVGAALVIMINPTYSTHIRVAAAKTIFLDASDVKIGAYLGTPVPIEKRDFPTRVGSKPVSLINVAYVRDSAREDMNIAPINSELHHIHRLAILDLLHILTLALKQPGLSDFDSERIHRILPRVISVTMAVLGAVHLDSVADAANDRGEIELVVSEGDRHDAVRWLMELVEFCNYNEDQLRDLRGMIETRLQVSAF